jgi:glycosyltransferase involved in cell wall biosynthesis
VRILHVSKFGWQKGGAEAYILRACERLAVLADVEVGLWAADSVGLADVARYDASIPDFHGARGLREKVDAAATVMWSRAAQRSLSIVLDDFAPDVVHLHNYAHQFSSSILELLRERRIPTVATAHDYKLICPSYLAVRDGRDCFDCATRLSFTPVRAKCLNDRATWSAVALAEAMLVRRRRLAPDVVLAPSEFMLERLDASWLRPLSALRLLRYPVDPSGMTWEGGEYLLYAGRLSGEKGVEELIVRSQELSLPLKIAGDGPERERLEALAVGAPDIEFFGHVDEVALGALRRRCLAQVVPSAWPENFPLTSLEAAADGVPLIVSNRGGMSELIRMGARGAVINTPDISGWRQALADIQLLHPLSELDQLRLFRDRVSWESHLPNLLEVYERAISARHVASREAVLVGAHDPFVKGINESEDN